MERFLEKALANMTKPKSPDYRQGWGDCKADLLRMVQEALRSLHEVSKPNPVVSPTEENIKALRAREAELRRVRAVIKSLENKGR